MWNYGIAQSQHYSINNNNMEGKHDNKELDLNKEHLFPRVSGYKRWIDNKEVHIMEFKVYYINFLGKI